MLANKFARPSIFAPRTSVLLPSRFRNAGTPSVARPQFQLPVRNLVETSAPASTPAPQTVGNSGQLFDMSYFYGVASQPFPEIIANKLAERTDPLSVEIKPDGQLYLPAAMYRKQLNKIFGPGGWGLVPRGPVVIENGILRREYALFCLGRFVSQAHGDQPVAEFGGYKSVATAEEAARSNALTRCCKDIGIAIELWEPSFNTEWKSKYAVEVWTTGVGKGTNENKQRKLWRRKDRPAFSFPWKEQDEKATSSTFKKAAPKAQAQTQAQEEDYIE